MTPFKKRNPFADMIRETPVPETPPVPAKSRELKTRPAGIQSRIVLLKRREDGTVLERSARPAFLFRDPKSATGQVVLPPDYYWRDSPEHIARRKELGAE